MTKEQLTRAQATVEYGPLTDSYPDPGTNPLYYEVDSEVFEALVKFAAQAHALLEEAAQKIEAEKA